MAGTRVATRTRPDYLSVVADLRLFHTLSEFDPHLAGSHPLGLPVEDSDLDILCHATDLDHFERVLCDAFGTFPNFAIGRRVASMKAVICQFDAGDMRIEVFGEGQPVARQTGWRHLIVERRLLNAGGGALLAAVKAARNRGLKTEPAFAACLGLEGDAIDALLELEACSEDELRELVRKAGY